MGNLHSLPVI